MCASYHFTKAILQLAKLEVQTIYSLAPVALSWEDPLAILGVVTGRSLITIYTIPL